MRTLENKSTNFRKGFDKMSSQKKTFSTIMLVLALIAALMLGAFSLSGCKKDDTTDNKSTNEKVTTKKSDKGAITLETSATVHVDIPDKK